MSAVVCCPVCCASVFFFPGGLLHYASGFRASSGGYQFGSFSGRLLVLERIVF